MQGSAGAEPVVDVAIVGCGPVGACLATLLGQRGRSVVVLERHPAPYPLPRAVHFDHEAGRILQACGLGPVLAEISEPGSEYEWRNAAGRVLLRFGGRPVGPSGWPDSSMFWQPALEAALEDAAAAQPSVEVRRGTSVTELCQHPDHVELAVADADGSPLAPVRARHVVGADGARSTVRELLGTPVTDLGFFSDWLVVDLQLHDDRTFDPINVQVCDPARPTTLVSGGPGRRRWEFMRLPHETVEELDDEARAWELLAPWDVHPGGATLERHAVYRFQARWAQGWRDGRVLLAGDAAHQMPPFAGQGMCAGLRDAANLAWKLDLVLAGEAPDGLLDAYELERAEHVRTVIELSMALGRVICIADPAEAAARDEQMARPDGAPAQAPPPLPGIAAGVVRADDPAAGELFVQGRVAVAGGAALLDDVVGAGWRLISPHPVGLDAELRSWFASVGGAVVAVPAAGDVDGTYARWFERHDVAVVLQRPDFHLFGTAPLGGADRLVADLRSALRSPTIPVPAPGGAP